MSLTILNKKLDALNEKEKRLRQMYDVRGTNKYQHRYIKDLKEDFKEDLILRYGNKPYGLGWHENELAEEEEERQENEIEDIQEDNGVVEEEEENEKENDSIPHGFSQNNFRPASGHMPASNVYTRPFSASVARPMTASSTKGGSSNSQMFMFQNRPISAIANGLKSSGNQLQDISEFHFHGIKSPQNPSVSRDGPQNLQASLSNQSLPTKMKVNESMFWKNTKKYDISKSTKQFDTKNLLFETSHSNPKLIAKSDLQYLEGSQIGGLLESSKLKAPKNYEFQEIALKKRVSSQPQNIEIEDNFKDNFDLGSDEESDAKITFNQSLSYIQQLRIDTPSDSKAGNSLFSHDPSSNRIKKLQRPVTAHPMISSGSTTSHKKPLEIITENVQTRNRQVYFSSLSDLRKKAFFLKLYSIEHDQENHPNSNKEIKTVDWQAFQNVLTKVEFQSLQLLLLDLNTYDHAKYELELQGNGILKAKDKDQHKSISEVHSEFLEATKTNLAYIIIFYETSSNKMMEVFSRVLVFEKQESEYDLLIWRNIYKFLLHKIVLGNSPVYNNVKAYREFSKIIQDIIEDRADYVSPIFKQIQQTQNHPVIVERNRLVYNFDFHSYIIECSSFYSDLIDKVNPKFEDTQQKGRKAKINLVSNKKMRPFSAIDFKTKSPSEKGQQLQALQRVHESQYFDDKYMAAPMIIPSPQKSQRSPQNSSNRPNTAASHYKTNLNKIIEEVYDNEKGFSTTRKSNEKRDFQPFLPNGKRTKPAAPDMNIQGDRMEIHLNKTAPNFFSQSNGRLPLNQLLSPSGASMTEQAAHNFSQFSSPKGFSEIFEPDDNGITVRYKKSLMKKKNSVIIKRPSSSYQKKPITPHKTEFNGNIGIKFDRNGVNIPQRFKF